MGRTGEKKMTSQASIFDGIDIADVRRKLARFTDNCQRLDMMHEYLLGRYPRDWVAVEGGIITRAATEEKLIELLEDPGTAAIKFLDPNPKTLILVN